MDIYKKQTFSESFRVYFDLRMIKILLLGAISGFPWVIIGSSLSLLAQRRWIKQKYYRMGWINFFLLFMPSIIFGLQ